MQVQNVPAEVVNWWVEVGRGVKKKKKKSKLEEETKFRRFLQLSTFSFVQLQPASTNFNQLAPTTHLFAPKLSIVYSKFCLFFYSFDCENYQGNPTRQRALPSCLVPREKAQKPQSTGKLRHHFI